MLLTLDSSVIVAALRQQEQWHVESLHLLERVRSGEHFAVQPYTTLIEVAEAIRRRTSTSGMRSLGLQSTSRRQKSWRAKCPYANYD